MSDDKLVCKPGEDAFCDFHGAYHRVWPVHSLWYGKLETLGELMDIMSNSPPPWYNQALWDPAYLEDPVTGEP